MAEGEVPDGSHFNPTSRHTYWLMHARYSKRHIDKPGRYPGKWLKCQTLGRFLTKATWQILGHGFNNHVNKTQTENIKNQQVKLIRGHKAKVKTLTTGKQISKEQLNCSDTTHNLPKNTEYTPHGQT